MAAFQQLPSMEEMAELKLKTEAAAAGSNSLTGGKNKRRQSDDNGDGDDVRGDDAKKVRSEAILPICNTV
jgi:hypothetical protein